MDRVRLLRDNQYDQYISNTDQSEESTTNSTVYFEKINTISESEFKTGQYVFSFNHVAVQAMAFSHKRFFELLVPEINRSVNRLILLFFKHGDVEGGVSF